MTREDEMIIESQKRYDDIAFLDGVKWADEHPNLESLWHDASEEPQDDLVIIYQDKCGNCWFITKRDIVILYINWERFAVNVRCWAYINDLLPKQLRKSEQVKGE